MTSNNNWPQELEKSMMSFEYSFLSLSNTADPSDYRTVCEINMYVPSAELGSDSVFRQ